MLNVVVWQGSTFATMQPNVLAAHADFIGFHAASQIVASGQGDRLYDIEAQQSRQLRIGGSSTPLLYYRPPFHLLLYLPLAPLSLEAAYFVFYGVNLLLLVGLAWLLRPAAVILGNSLGWTLLALAAFIPASLVLVQGQDSLLALAVLTLVWRALQARREFYAGLLLALLLFKFQIALPMVVVFAMARRWTVLKGFAAGIVPVVAACIAVSGWHTAFSYPFFLLEMSGSGAYGTIQPWMMPNLRGLLESTLGGVGWVRAAILLGGFALLLTGGRAWREDFTKESVDLRFAYVMTVVLLASHHLNPHDITLLALPLLLASRYLATHPVREGTFTMLIAALFLPTLYVLLLRWHGLYLIAVLFLLFAGGTARELFRRRSRAIKPDAALSLATEA